MRTGAERARALVAGLRQDANAAASESLVVGAAAGSQDSRLTVANASLDSVTHSVADQNAVITVVIRDEERFGEDLNREARELLRTLEPVAVELAVQTAKQLR